jgi:hypothetical protein
VVFSFTLSTLFLFVFVSVVNLSCARRVKHPASKSTPPLPLLQRGSSSIIMQHRSYKQSSQLQTMLAISRCTLCVILALVFAAAPAQAQIVCQVISRAGCFTDYIQSKRCYPVGPIDVKSQAIIALPLRPFRDKKSNLILSRANRWSALRTARSCPTSTRPSSTWPSHFGEMLGV